MNNDHQSRNSHFSMLCIDSMYNDCSLEDNVYNVHHFDNIHQHKCLHKYVPAISKEDSIVNIILQFSQSNSHNFPGKQWDIQR